VDGDSDVLRRSDRGKPVAVLHVDKQQATGSTSNPSEAPGKEDIRNYTPPLNAAPSQPCNLNHCNHVAQNPDSRGRVLDALAIVNMIWKKGPTGGMRRLLSWALSPRSHRTRTHRPTSDESEARPPQRSAEPLADAGCDQFERKLSRHLQLCSKWYCPIVLDRQVCWLRVLSHRDFAFFQIRLVREFYYLRVPDANWN